MRKLILRTALSPGDIVLLTAAVRDLHTCYPDQFVTDVRTTCSDLWENNPHLTPLTEDEPGVEILDCSYPLIDRCNDSACHVLHGFIDFLNEKLGLRIRPTVFRGDIHLSPAEMAWRSQVHEWTGQDTPFWIVAAGGKYDVTIKWWDSNRYQEVVDRFRGKVQFVQVGGQGHYHPKLNGAIDLRGRTSLRELVRLVYHAQGIVCGVTALMHLAAAVPTRAGRQRPCIVIAGGREPVHWEAYPGHQFLATNGLLKCCGEGGCWRARTAPLGDGDERDLPDHLCTDVVEGLPHCMHLIESGDVIRRIEQLAATGVVQYLTPEEKLAGRRAVIRSAQNGYDNAPLTLHNARLMCERFILAMPLPPDHYAGRGIVLCGGGVKYFTCAWVCINMLRHLGCSLPIELWYLGKELDRNMEALVAPLGVLCVDATESLRRQPMRCMGGWELKPYAILHSRFKEVLFLDADNVPVRNPEFLFDTPQYKATGALFWPDFGRLEKGQVIWDSCGLPRPAGPEFESGQLVVDKGRCWGALRLALWFNEHSDFFYQHVHGDKETFHLAFHKLRKSYSLVRTPIHRLDGTMCQHDFNGERLFQHRNMDKWNLFARNRRVLDFQHEDQCFTFLAQLQANWDGRMGTFRPKKRMSGSRRGAFTIRVCMISCAEREETRNLTLANLAATDWGDEPVFVQLDPGESECRKTRQTHTAWLALKETLQWNADYLLFLEDDLIFNAYLRHNLLSWNPLKRGLVSLAGLYNPNLRPLAWDSHEGSTLIAPESVFGSQAYLLSRRTVEFLVAHWAEADGMQDIRMSRLAGRFAGNLYYHSPSLVQHRPIPSVWGGAQHAAWDFEEHWRRDA